MILVYFTTSWTNQQNTWCFTPRILSRLVRPCSKWLYNPTSPTNKTRDKSYLRSVRYKAWTLQGIAHVQGACLEDQQRCYSSILHCDAGAPRGKAAVDHLRSAGEPESKAWYEFLVWNGIPINIYYLLIAWWDSGWLYHIHDLIP